MPGPKRRRWNRPSTGSTFIFRGRTITAGASAGVADSGPACGSRQGAGRSRQRDVYAQGATAARGVRRRAATATGRDSRSEQDHDKPTPFTLRIPDADIADLRERLARTRFPDQAPGEAWAYGTDVAYLRELAEYWRNGFRLEGGGSRAERLSAIPRSARRHRAALSARARRRPRSDAAACCCTAGPARCSSFSTSSRASPIPRASAATRAMPSPWWRRPCRDMACRSSPARSGSAFPKWRIVSPPSCMTCSATRRFGAQGGDWGAAVTSRLGYAHAEPDDRHPHQSDDGGRPRSRRLSQSDRGGAALPR